MSLFEKARNEFLFQKSSELIFIHSFEADMNSERFYEVNDTTLQQLGYSREEFLELSPIKLLSGGLKGNPGLKFIRNSFQNTNTTTYPLSLKQRNGEKFLVDVTSYKFKAEDKEFLLSIARPAHLRQQLEEKLLESEQMLEHVLNSIPEGIFWKNREGHYLGCNMAYALSWGFELAGEIIGKTDFDLNMTKEQAQFFREQDLSIMESGVPHYAIEMHISLTNGISLWIITNKMPFRDNEGNVIGIIGSFQDITQKVQSDLVIQRTQQELSLRNKLIQLFLATWDRQIYHQMLSIVMDHFHVGAGVFGMVDESEQLNELVIINSLEEHEFIDIRIPDLREAIGYKTVQIYDNSTHLPLKHRSLMNGAFVPIIHHSDVIGFFLLANRINHFSPEDLTMLESAATEIAPILQSRIERDQHEWARLEIEQKLENLLKEKEILLREVHHRVKNNLQIIAGLITLQTKAITDEKSLHLLKDFQNRIKSLALIHEHFYQSPDFAHYNSRKYFEELVNNIFQSYQTNPNLIHLKMNIDDIELEPNQAMLCGLILNELVSNALKHAFLTESKGELRVDLIQQDQIVFLKVIDNGIGFPVEINLDNPQSVGLELVMLLIDQLKGTLIVTRKPGTIFEIKFQKKAT